MKKKISVLAAVLLAFGLTACGNNDGQTSVDTTQTTQTESTAEMETTNNDESVEDASLEVTESSEEKGGTLVVYFSATRTTKGVAKKIAAITGASEDEIRSWIDGMQ